MSETCSLSLDRTCGALSTKLDPVFKTTEIFAFLEAAHERKRQGGVPVNLQTVIDQAQATKRQRPHVP